MARLDGFFRASIQNVGSRNASSGAPEPFLGNRRGANISANTPLRGATKSANHLQFLWPNCWHLGDWHHVRPDGLTQRASFSGTSNEELK